MAKKNPTDPPLAYTPAVIRSRRILIPSENELMIS